MKLLELADPFAKDDMKFFKNLIKLLLITIGGLLGAISVIDFMFDLGNDLLMFGFGLAMTVIGLYIGMCVQFSRQNTADGSK